MGRRPLSEEERKARRKETKRRSDKKRRKGAAYKEKAKIYDQRYYKKNPEKFRNKNETYYDNNRPELLLYAKNKREKVKATKHANDLDPPEGAVEDYYEFMRTERWRIKSEFPHYSLKEIYKAVFQSWTENPKVV